MFIFYKTYGNSFGHDKLLGYNKQSEHHSIRSLLRFVVHAFCSSSGSLTLSQRKELLFVYILIYSLSWYITDFSIQICVVDLFQWCSVVRVFVRDLKHCSRLRYDACDEVTSSYLQLNRLMFDQVTAVYSQE